MTVAVQPLYDPNVVVASVAAHDVRYPPVEPGAAFVDETLDIASDFQADMLTFSEIDPAFYAGEVDPGLLARRPISVIGSALFNAHPERGYVHTVQKVERFAPLPAGAPVTMRGAFTAVDPHPRGWMMHARFEFLDADGALALVVSPSALMADPERNTAAPAAKQADATTPDDRMQALAAEGWTRLHDKTCTPERVVGYCGKTRNLIHTDPAYAQGFGFRAPITAGNQMIEWHLEAAKMRAIGERYEGAVKLQRPVFWDDPVTVMTRGDGDVVETIVVKQDGKVANSGRFERAG